MAATPAVPAAAGVADPWTARLLDAAPDLHALIAHQQAHIADQPNPGSDDAYGGGCSCDREANHDGYGSWFGEMAGVPLFTINPDCPMHGEEEDES